MQPSLQQRDSFLRASQPIALHLHDFLWSPCQKPLVPELCLCTPTFGNCFVELFRDPVAFSSQIHKSGQGKHRNQIAGCHYDIGLIGLGFPRDNCQLVFTDARQHADLTSCAFDRGERLGLGEDRRSDPATRFDIRLGAHIPHSTDELHDPFPIALGSQVALGASAARKRS